MSRYADGLDRSSQQGTFESKVRPALQCNAEGVSLGGAVFLAVP
ncbi:hypothetical protein PC116_g12123 [Phytophthora cactorum]|nr:hypothetical protein PC114_g9552 [Phytophthora cactorum]KAG3006611.1 hypothetical protein PC120_g17264 [Phytophthora cactorum]KAG3023030.1 hypothetical protein PC119_g9044 [Phytophthora cactorum]KAG3169479.1 hypothetical protein PC128_g19144 [Phytophthora cactorum]KAG3173214.1 hypothetical protein C6341_g10088 [Phytophthora cactorum]